LSFYTETILVLS